MIAVKSGVSFVAHGPLVFNKYCSIFHDFKYIINRHMESKSYFIQKSFYRANIHKCDSVSYIYI